jgi:hypothetical protein
VEDILTRMEALDPMAIQELTYMFQQNSRLPMPFKVVLKKATCPITYQRGKTFFSIVSLVRKNLSESLYNVFFVFKTSDALF